MDRPPEPPPSPQSLGRTGWALLAAIALLAAGLRIGGMFTEFWLDEIWSWALAWVEAKSTSDILLRVYAHNNHFLNTLFIRALGRQPWWGYRLPSLVTGIATVPLAACVARRYGRAAALLTATLAAVCYLLVHYSSEARGNAPAAFLALACFHLLRRGTRDAATRWPEAIGFSAAAALGILSHLTFFFPLAAMGIWWAAALARRRVAAASVAREFAAYFAVPAAISIALYVVNLRHLPVITRGTENVHDGLLEASMWLLGVPRVAPVAFAAGAAFLAALAWEVVRMWRQGLYEWTFYAALLAMTPSLPLLLGPSVNVYPRYLLVWVPFFLILLARLAVDVAGRGPVARAAVLLALLGFCGGNAVHVARFLSTGRGHYREALQYMASHTTAPAVTVAADQDFRNYVVLVFYFSNLPQSKAFRYSPNFGRQGAPPEWFLAHTFEGDPPRPPEITPNAGRYRLQQVFDYAGASGWTWWLYRLEAPAASAPTP